MNLLDSGEEYLANTYIQMDLQVIRALVVADELAADKKQKV